MPFFQFWEDAHGGAWTYAGEEVGDIYGAKLRTVEDKKSPYYGFPLLVNDDGAGNEWTYEDAHNTKNKVGNFNPDFLLGTQLRLRFKNWSLNATFDWRHGGDFVSRTYQYGMENGYARFQFNQFIDPGELREKGLRDYLMEHADQYVKPDGNWFPRIGFPSPEHKSYPFLYSGINLPYGALIIPGVVEDPDHPGEYIENLGENINGGAPEEIDGHKSQTFPVPGAASNPW